MAQAISAILALLVGFATWSLIAILSKGAYPLGEAGALEGAIFFAPIVGMVLPAAVRSFGSETPVSGVWLLAVAPFAGVLNFIPYVFFYALSQLIWGKSGAEVIAACLSVGIWAIPLYLQIRSRKPVIGSSAPEKAVKLLRRPGRF